MEYNLNRPWETLDEWQKEYIETPPEQDCFLLCTRQGGKTTAMSIKSVEMCIKHFGDGEIVLISSLTERQAQMMLKKAQIYAEAKYPRLIDNTRENKPTMHRIFFKNGSGILCYAAGEEGDSTRGYTLKKLMVDEGSRMNELYFISATPTLSVAKGSMDVASTPHGKTDKDGNETFFYKASKDDNYKKFYISAKDCPRHDEEFLKREQERMSKLQYAQEYLAQFLDELQRVFSEEWIKNVCSLKRRKEVISGNSYFLGVDVGGWGKDIGTCEILDGTKEVIEQVENEILRKKLTTETSNRIQQLNSIYNFNGIGVDDGGLGFGVFSELMSNEKTRRKTKPLNNATRPLNRDGTKKKKLLKEEMYQNLIILGENNKIKLLDDDEVIASLVSVQHEDEKIFGNYTHIVEGIIRAAWLIKTKPLNLYRY